MVAPNSEELRQELEKVRQELEEQQEQFSTLFEYSGDSIFIVDLETDRILNANANAARRLGYQPDELMKLTLSDIQMPVDSSNDDLLWESQTSGTLFFEETYRHKDGSPVPVDVSSRPTQIGGRSVLVNFVRDNTRRKRIEKAEREQRALAEALRDTAIALTSTLDQQEVFNRILTNAGRIVPHDLAVIMLIEPGTGIVKLTDSVGLSPTNIEQADQTLTIAHSEYLRYMVDTQGVLIIPDTQSPSGYNPPFRAKNMRAYVSAPIILEDDVIGFIHLASSQPDSFTPLEADHLQAFTSQAAIAIRNARLYDQAREFAALQERHRFAGDLHDTVTQTLFSINLIAESLLYRPEKCSEEMIKQIQMLHRLSRGALAEARSLLMTLSPERQLEGRLSDLLRQLTEAVQSRKALDITFSSNFNSQVPYEVKSALYRITQEALNNVIKHANAQHVIVYLGGGDDQITLYIEDDGRGFEADQKYPGMGQNIMRERAETIGAALTLTSTPGTGTKVQIALPMKKWQDENAP